MENPESQNSDKPEEIYMENKPLDESDNVKKRISNKSKIK